MTISDVFSIVLRSLTKEKMYWLCVLVFSFLFLFFIRTIRRRPHPTFCYSYFVWRPYRRRKSVNCCWNTGWIKWNAKNSMKRRSSMDVPSTRFASIMPENWRTSVWLRFILQQHMLVSMHFAHFVCWLVSTRAREIRINPWGLRIFHSFHSPNNLGTLKRRCELMLPWLIAHAFGYFLIVASVLTIYFTNNRLRCLFAMDNIWGEFSSVSLYNLLILLTQIYDSAFLSWWLMGEWMFLYSQSFPLVSCALYRTCLCGMWFIIIMEHWKWWKVSPKKLSCQFHAHR